MIVSKDNWINCGDMSINLDKVDRIYFKSGMSYMGVCFYFSNGYTYEYNFEKDEEDYKKLIDIVDGNR